MQSLPQQCDATTNHFGVRMLSNQHAKKKKKELPVCSCDPSWWPRGNQMTLFGGDRKDYVWLPEDSQGIFSRSMTHSKNERKMMAMQKWQRQLGMEVCFTLAGKEPNLLRSWRIRKHWVESGGKKWGSICSGLETTGKIRTIASTRIYYLFIVLCGIYTGNFLPFFFLVYYVRIIYLSAHFKV